MKRTVQQLVQETKYPIEAFAFVHKGLDYTVRQVHGDELEAMAPADEGQAQMHEAGAASQPSTAAPRSRHVTGRQLCHGLRDFALEQYGLMAQSVLRRWNICNSEDFGHIVFKMVDAGLMATTDEDELADFVEVFDLAQALRPEFVLK